MILPQFSFAYLKGLFKNIVKITTLINGKLFHDIGLYVWKIFPPIQI
jgi:hypothetical protein|tara:strand:+ start:102 stop:242 length:141 start_codon:yes stop_codon:yes gene_type:complete